MNPARPSPLRPAAAIAAIAPPLPVETECAASVPPPVSVGSSEGGSSKRFRPSSLVSEESSAVTSRPASHMTPRPPPLRTRGSFGASPQPADHPPDAAKPTTPALRQGRRPPPIHTRSSFGPLDRDSPECVAFAVVAGHGVHGHRELSLGGSSNDGSSPRQARQDPDLDPDPDH
eukprot:scaffold108872_cov54-Phaeocystis_antarctica.AAC.1